MNQMQAKRLIKLADFLEHKVPDKAFSFTNWFNLGDKMPLDALKAGGGCGTVCCAVGWMPAVWPKSFKWIAPKIDDLDDPEQNNEGSIRLIKSDGTFKSSWPLHIAKEWFGLTELEAEYMFLHQDSWHNTDLPYTKQLPADASKEQVAQRLREVAAKYLSQVA